MTHPILTSSVDAVAVERDFLQEFGDQLSPEQIDMLTSGYRTTAAAKTVDPETIDPRKDPVAAQAALLERPKTSLVWGDAPTVWPLVKLLRAMRDEIPVEIRVLQKEHRFFLVKYSLNAVVDKKERVAYVDLKFAYPDGRFSTWSLTPDTELEERFQAQASVSVGLDSELRLAGAISNDTKSSDSKSASASAVANAGLALGLQWEYHLMRAKITATGKRSSFARWTIEDPKRVVGSVDLATVVAVSKNTDELSFRVEGRYEVERGWAWWKKTTPVVLQSDGALTLKLPNSDN